METHNDKDELYESLQARAYLRNGQFEMAIQHRRKSTEVRGKDAAVDHLLVAVALAGLGRSDEARQSLEHAGELFAKESAEASWSDRLSLRKWLHEAE